MDFPESIFVVMENDKCPIYKMGDEFKLTGRSLSTPLGKSACLTLMNDITYTMTTWQNLRKLNMGSESGFLFICSGKKTACPGVIRLGHQIEKKTGIMKDMAKLDQEISAIANVLGKFNIFDSLDKKEIKEIVSFFRIRDYRAGETIIKKGDPGLKLYIIVSGKVEIVGENDFNIATLGRGEVFGEMSLLSGDSVSTTVRTIEDSKLLYLYGTYFRNVLNRFPSIQIYFARLLAKRLATSNTMRSREFSSGINGKLSEISPSELLQTLNMNHKTGIVEFELDKKFAHIAMREGSLVRANIDDLKGPDAFFEILKQREGRFKFIPGLPEKDQEAQVLGDFMWLLMEGLNRIDEAGGKEE